MTLEVEACTLLNSDNYADLSIKPLLDICYYLCCIFLFDNYPCTCTINII